MWKRVTLVSWSHPGGQVKAVKPGALFRGFVWAFTSTAFICAALVLWAFMTVGDVYHYSGIFTASTLLGAFLGGAVSGRAAGSMGWLHGAGTGLLYSLVITSFVAVWEGGADLELLAARCAALLLLSVLGGVTGVNLPAGGRRRPPVPGRQ